jgi:hypothetical protein
VEDLKEIMAGLPDAVFDIIIGFVAACTTVKPAKNYEPLTRALAAVYSPDTITHQYAVFVARSMLATGKPVLDDMPDEIVAQVVRDMREVNQAGGSWWIERDEVDCDDEWLTCLLQLSKHGNFVVTFSPRVRVRQPLLGKGAQGLIRTQVFDATVRNARWARSRSRPASVRTCAP